MTPTFHLINGCTFGFELVDGKDADPDSQEWFMVFDLFLVRIVINI